MIARLAPIAVAASLAACAHRPVYGPPLCALPIASWLECRVTAPATVRLGEPVRIAWSLRNLSAHASYRVLGTSTPWGVIDHDDVLVVRRDGRPVAHDTLELSGAGPREVPMSAWLVLPPGETIRATVDLTTAGYTLVEPGRYEVDTGGLVSDLHEGPPLGGTDASGTRSSPVRAVRDFRPALLACDRVTFTVVPADAPDAGAAP